MTQALQSRRARARPTSLPLHVALWCGPMAAILHNLEEYPAIVAYGQRHFAQFGLTMPGVDAMRPAVILADIIPLLTCALAVTSPRGSARRLPIIVVLASYFANAFSHIGQTIVFREYSPGTVTAVILSIPVNAYLFRRAYNEGFAARRDMVLAAGIGIATMPISIVGLQSLGGILSSL